MQTVAKPVFSIESVEFEGPLELLIELVEKRKLLINNISLANVTDEYMTRVKEMQERSLPNTAQFVALAATLLLIKSKSLLPSLDLTVEEESNIEELEERLKLYQLYREAGIDLQKIFGAQVLYEPEYNPPREPLFISDVFCNTTSLVEAMERVITNLPRETEKKPTAKVKQSISLEDMMQNLKNRIEKQFRLSFFEMKDQETEHKTVIVGFLAILELFKQGNILITQITRFEDISLELERQDTPRYY